MKNRTVRFTLAILVALAVSACAGNLQPKQVTVNTVQTISGSLAVAQDVERAICSPTAPAGTPISACTADAAKIGLTTERHRAIAGAFARAFEANIKLATAAKAWQPNAPVPNELTEIMATTKEALAVVEQLFPSAGTTSIMETIRKVMAAIDAFAAQWKSGAVVAQ